MDFLKKTFMTELLYMNDKFNADDIEQISSIKEDNNGTIIFSKQLVGIDDRYAHALDHPQEVDDVKHTNDFFEILYSPSGNINININGRDEILNKDEILFLNKNVVYSVHKIAIDSNLLCHVFINEELFDDDFFSMIQENNVFSLFIVKSMFLSNMYRDCLKTKNVDKYVLMILALLREQARKRESNKKILISYFAILFDKLNNYENNLVETDEFIRYYKKNAQILKIIGYIRNNYRTADLKSVAQNVHLHTNYLCSLVKSVTGKTFTEILNSIKMQIAKHMLDSTDHSIEHISSAVGYDNPSYFYTTFKKIYKVTPGEYRTSGCDKNKAAVAYVGGGYSSSHNDISYLISKKLLYTRGETPKIVFMPMGTELNYYMTSIGNGLIKGLYNKSIDMLTAAPESPADSEKQNEILQDIIEQKPHGIIICSHDLQIAAPLLKKAIEAGIVICLINHDNAHLPVPVHAVVGYRQKEATSRMGAYIAEKMAGNRIRAGIIRGVPGYHSTQRFNGFLEPLLDMENFDITAVRDGLWNEQSGFDVARQMLLEHPEINLIFAENDHQAVGAIKAATQLGRQNVKIVGHDGAISGLRNIVSGRLFATTDTHPVEMGTMAIMAVLNCLDGNIPGSFLETPSNIVDKRNVVSALFNNM